MTGSVTDAAAPLELTVPELSVPELSVIVPFFNEEDNFALYRSELFPAIDQLGLRSEVLLVDDGSSDRSYQRAVGLAGTRPGVRVLRHERNRGLGAAVRTGIAEARGALVLTIDADLTFHPRHAGALLAKQREGGFDLVSGSPSLARFEGVPWWRIALSKGANLLYQLSLGRRLTSVTPLFRLYRRSVLEGLELESERFEINAEILAKLVFRGARVAEVPVPLTVRRHGESKLDNRREIANHLRLLRKIWRWRLARRG